MKHYTQWFYEQKPVHKGVYQRNYKLFTKEWSYSYWDGKRWGMSADTADQAAYVKNRASNFQKIPWRGLCK